MPTALEKLAHFIANGGVVVEYLVTIDKSTPVRLKADDMALLPDGEALVAHVKISGRKRGAGRPPGNPPVSSRPLKQDGPPAPPEVVASILDALRSAGKPRLSFPELAAASGVPIAVIRKAFKAEGGVPGTVVTGIYAQADGSARVRLA
jgi:hypothetical protein